jgi:hypothetical protein
MQPYLIYKYYFQLKIIILALHESWITLLLEEDAGVVLQNIQQKIKL